MAERTQAAARTLRPAAEEAFEAYHTLVTASIEQMERHAEVAPAAGGDAWVGRAATFRPGTQDAPEMVALLALAQAGDTWIDVGAGGGRFAVPLSRAVARVIAIEPSAAMREVLADAAAEAGRDNIETLARSWPPAEGASEVPVSDVVLAANLTYDATDLQGFLASMEAYARRACAVIVSDRAARTPDAATWEALTGEPLCPLPALREFVTVLAALERRYEVRTFPVAAPVPVDPDRALQDMAWRFGVSADSARGERLRALLVDRYGEPSGLVRPPPRRRYTAVVSWEPATG